MHQFNVYRIGPEITLGSVDISFTNASLFMMMSALAIIVVLFAARQSWASSRNTDLRMASMVVGRLSFIQIFVGAANPWLEFSSFARSLHLAIAAAVWGSLIMLLAFSGTNKKQIDYD